MKSGSDIVLPASLVGGAAILSILTGFFSGVSLGVILLRCLLIALGALGFVFASGWVIRKFLPELIDFSGRQSGAESSDSQPVSGSHVDIVMPEETPSAGRISPDDGTESQSSHPAGDGLSEMDDPDSEIAENHKNVHNNKPEESDIESTAASRGINLDILPSLDTLELSGESASSVEELDSVEEEPAQVLNNNKANLGGSNDPAEIAKAVKTVLKRDQH